MQITANSYFSGAGLFDIGFRQAGIKVNQSFEIDEICCKTQRATFDHEVIQMDLTKKLVKEYPTTSIIELLQDSIFKLK